jgi:sodium-dependent dicarboxylate transporter 2/3/5
MKLKNKHILLGPLFALLIYFLQLDEHNDMSNRMAAIAFWMGYWWLSEAVNFAVTAFIPIIFLPVLGIADTRIIASQYMDPILFLFIGGFLIAFAIEKWSLHERLALFILKIIGSKPSFILLGVMLSAFILSMWISNTATTMMLLSAVLALIYKLDKIIPSEEKKSDISSALLLGLAYSATIGGLATLVGTPTNMIFYRAYLNAYPNTNDITFVSWFIQAFPFALIFLGATFIVLKVYFLKNTASIKISKSTFSEAYKDLGKWSYEEKIILVIFFLTAILWFTRADLKIGSLLFFTKFRIHS